MLFAETISETVSPAPKSKTILRKTLSVTPAMGAMISFTKGIIMHQVLPFCAKKCKDAIPCGEVGKFSLYYTKTVKSVPAVSTAYFLNATHNPWVRTVCQKTPSVNICLFNGKIAFLSFTGYKSWCIICSELKTPKFFYRGALQWMMKIRHCPQM